MTKLIVNYLIIFFLILTIPWIAGWIVTYLDPVWGFKHPPEVEQALK